MEKKDVLGMLEYFDRVQKVTFKVIKSIPANKLNYKPCPEVMSLKELVHHIYANEKVFAQGVAKGFISEEDFKKENRKHGSIKSLLDYAKSVRKNTNLIAKKLTDKQLKRKVKTFWGAPLPAFICFTAFYDEHWHHRGQLYTYLRLLGIKPPDLYDYK